MRTIRLQYLHKNLYQKLNFKALLQAFFASLFLSACGIKGDLYQTPEQPVTEKEIADVDANKVQGDSNKSESSENKPVVQQTVEQVSEKPTKPVVETVPERVKGANNVS